MRTLLQRARARLVALPALGVAGYLSATSLAHAQIPAATSQGIAGAIGSDTSGSETGIYEITAAIETVWKELLAVVVLVIAFRLVLRAMRRISGTM